jgi:hypothetical protein
LRLVARLAALALLAVCAARPLEAQEESGAESALRLDDFRLSSPPAFVLLGSSASSVARPNTPRALIASLISASGSSGLIPDGYAMETSPYWLLRHPALDLNSYYKASIGERLRYFTAISAATSRPSSESDSVERDARVALAIRTLLFNGRPGRALVATSDSIRSAQLTYIDRYRRLETAKAATNGLAAQRRRLTRNEDLLSTLVTKVLVGPDRELRDSTLRTLARRDSARAAVALAEAAEQDVARLEKELESLETRLSRIAERFADRDAEPDGFVLELAFGMRALFERGEWDRQRSDGLGIWITPMYRLSSSHLELIGVARYLTRVLEYDESDVLDLGARAGWDVGKLGISAEWVRRNVRDADEFSSSRWAGLLDYKLPASFSLVASFGSDFRRADGNRPVIATIGLNLGFGALMLVPSRPSP